MGREFNDFEGIDAVPSGMPEGATFTSVLARVLEKCHEDGTGCWHWNGFAIEKASPQPMMSYHGKPMSVRRAVWIETRGAVKPKHVISSTCESYMCVAPMHLEQLSRSALTARNVASGRQSATSEARTAASRKRVGKLNMERARFIRASKLSAVALAAMFNVSAWAIGLCRRGETWKEAGPTPFTGLGARRK